MLNPTVKGGVINFNLPPPPNMPGYPRPAGGDTPDDGVTLSAYSHAGEEWVKDPGGEYRML